MRSFALLTVIASALFVLTSAQTLPACATPCLTQAIAASANSNCGTNIACLCGDSTFLNSALSCVETSCQGADLQNAIQAAQAQCASAGVTVNPATLTATGGSTPSGSGSASASSPTSPAAGSTPAGSGSSSSPASSPSTSPSSAAMVGAAPGGLVAALLAVAGIAVAL